MSQRILYEDEDYKVWVDSRQFAIRNKHDEGDNKYFYSKNAFLDHLQTSRLHRRVDMKNVMEATKI